jgi:hypothetical protein
MKTVVERITFFPLSLAQHGVRARAPQNTWAIETRSHKYSLCDIRQARVGRIGAMKGIYRANIVSHNGMGRGGVGVVANVSGFGGGPEGVALKHPQNSRKTGKNQTRSLHG